MYGARAINRLPIKKRWNAANESLVAAANRQIQRSANARVNRMRGVLPYQRNILYRAPRNANLQEVKAFDVTITGGVMVVFGGVGAVEPHIAFAGITEVNCIAQGATVANRIGNKVVIKSVDLKLGFTAAAAVVGTLRMMLLYDRQPNGAFPAMTDILLSQPAGAAVALSGLNIANKSRFQMIRDQYINFDAGAGLVQILHWYCKGRWETEFGTNGGTIGDFRTGSLILAGYVAIGGGGNITMANGQCRCRYYD